jgi:hypothetical protein
VAGEISALNVAGAAITAGMGLLGLLFPAAASTLTGVTGVTPAGRSEFRATYGGLFLALGLAPLLTGAPAFYALAGLCWIGAAIGRIVSIGLDRAAAPMNFGAVVYEAAIGALLIAGAPLTTLLVS